MSDVADIAKGTCETCRFWKRGERPKAYDDFGAASEELIPAEFGDCRRYAPRGALVINEAASGMLSGEVWPWATVNENDWCGEYHLSALSGED